ncbi:MAG: hypothetical protein J6D54_04730 [Olsenella sp.]|nr:hypothetical protein [Olsenella sp.]
MRSMEETIRSMFWTMGLSPSQIDERLILPMGAAHDVIVSYWRWESEKVPAIV